MMKVKNITKVIFSKEKIIMKKESKTPKIQMIRIRKMMIKQKEKKIKM